MRTLAILSCPCALVLVAHAAAAQSYEPGADTDQAANRYARAGVVEVGGGAGVMVASDFRMISGLGSVGWFVQDDLELSVLFGVANIEANDDTETLVTALVEPAYHVPVASSVYAFAGIGLGAAVLGEHGTGVALAPRLGAKLAVGRSGLLAPAMSYQHVFNNLDDVSEMEGAALDAALDSLRFDITYSAFW